MLKLLLVGSDKEWAIENSYIKELTELCEVELYNSHGDFIDYFRKSIINKVLFRFGLSKIFDRLNQSFIKKVDEFQPEAILIFKGMEIFPSTLESLRRKNIKLFNYNPDHPFVYHSKGSGNINVLKSIRLYDHHFSYSKRILEELKEKFEIKSGSWLPFGYATAIAPDLSTDTAINKACFIGNADIERVKMIKTLALEDIPVDVYGLGWQNGLKGINNVRIYGPVYKEDFNSKAPMYDVQLNFFRPHNEDSHNMRTFEMPALGCIMLAPSSTEHSLIFKDKEEAFFYTSKEQMKQLCKEILMMTDEERNNIRWNAYNRSLNSGYSYKARARMVFNQINSILTNNKGA